MERFTRLTGIAAPLLRPNIDTNVIIPIDDCVSVPRVEQGRCALSRVALPRRRQRQSRLPVQPRAVSRGGHAAGGNQLRMCAADGRSGELHHHQCARLSNLRGINWLDRQAEIGIVIGDKACWSKGYGTDAMRVIMRIGFDTMALNRLWLKVLAFNDRGIRCYEKCCFRREGVLREDRFLDGKYCDGIVMGILEREYREAAKNW